MHLPFKGDGNPTKTKSKTGLTSVEAAALLLSEGKTTDPIEAELLASTDAMDMDALWRSGLRRSMGFDFEIKLRPNKIHVFSMTGPRVTAHAKVKPGEVDEYGNIVSEKLIDRLVNACLVLKQRHDAAVEKLEAAKR